MKLIFLWTIITYICFTEAVEEETLLIILHNADVQARFDETNVRGSVCSPKLKDEKYCIGGFPRMATIIKGMKKLESKSVIVLYLFAGGIFTGTSWFSIYKAKIAYTMMNSLKPDAVALGYSEFNLGIEGLDEYVKNLEAPVIAANMNTSSEKSFTGKILPSIIKEIEGLKIGIIGHITKSTPSKVYVSDKINFTDEIEAVQKEATALKAKGAKIIIVIGNSGLTVDQKIASVVEEVDCVIGGMDKIFLYNGPAPSTENPREGYPMVITQKSGKKVPIVHAFTYSKYIGCLNITFGKNGELLHLGGQPFFLSHNMKPDPEVLKVLDEFRSGVNELYTKPIGTSKVVLDASENVCSRKECNLGNLIADSYVEYDIIRNQGRQWTNTPIGFVNSGAMKRSIDVISKNGSITRGDLMDACPHGNRIAACSVTGETLKAVLEDAVRHDLQRIKGEFLQFSGVQVTYDLTKPVGKRVEELRVRCSACDVPKFQNLIESEIYNIVTSMYLLEGGDGYAYLKTNHFAQIVYPESDVDIMAEYIERHSPICSEDRDGIVITLGGGKNSLGVKIGIDYYFIFLIITQYFVSNICMDYKL